MCGSGSVPTAHLSAVAAVCSPGAASNAAHRAPATSSTLFVPTLLSTPSFLHAASSSDAPSGEAAAALAEAQCKKAELLNKVWTKKVLPLVWTRCGAFDAALGEHLKA